MFLCHRLVLACVSLYFRAMFKSQMSETFEKSIRINDIDEEAMAQLINFAYTSRIKLTTDNVQSILFAASILQVESVATACSNFMQTHLHPSNCIQVSAFCCWRLSSVHHYFSMNDWRKNGDIYAFIFMCFLYDSKIDFCRFCAINDNNYILSQ